MKKAKRIVALYSGSGGNSVFVRVGDTRLLVDAGKSARALCSALNEIGENIKDVDAIFVTHEHTDHVSALEVVAKKHNIPIHITDASAKRFDIYPTSAIHASLVRHEPIFSEQVGEITVRSFVTPHDSNMSVGYRMEFEEDGARHAIGLATDIGYASDEIRENLFGCEAVVLEANHDVDMLMNGPYPRELKMRVASRRGHLSNAESASLAAFLCEGGARAFMLAHLSRENNEPVLALDEVKSALGGYGATVIAAAPDMPTELFIEFDRESFDDKREIYNPWNA